MSTPQQTRLIEGACPRKLLVVCIDCLCGTYVDAEMPLIMQSWADVPMPEGWAWRASIVTALGISEHVAAPICPHCLAIWRAGNVPEFERRQDRARDLHGPGFLTNNRER